jgi:hypothetical protein
MNKFNAKQLRILKIVHILFFILWIGGGVGLITLMLIVDPLLPDDIYMKFRSMQVIDDFLIIPGAMGCLFIGIIYGVFTNWGFFKHNWVTVKWVLTVLQILFGTFVLGPWINGSVDIAREIRGAALSNPEFLNNTMNLKIWGTIQVSFLLFMAVISVIKPWKKGKP